MLVKFFRSVFKGIQDLVQHDGVEHAGYLSFLLMLAIFPFLFFLTAITGFFGDQKLAQFLIDMILESSWANFINALKPRILELVGAPPQNLLTIAVVGAVWTASSIFEAMRTCLNKANRVSSPPSYLWRRLFSIIEFFATITFIMIMIFALIIVPSVVGYFDAFVHYLPFQLSLLRLPEIDTIRTVLLFVLTLLLVALAYHTLPNRRAKFMHSVPGSVIVVAAWYLFSILFKYYVFYAPQVNVIYGSIASIIIALLYFYFCSIIFIFGAEFNYHISKPQGSKKK